MSDLRDLMQADVEAVFLTDFAQAVTIAGTETQAIINDTFEDDDPRAPWLRVATSDLDGVNPGATVTIGAASYKIEVIRPGREGMSELRLSAVL